jgi:hypothetical protein
MQVTVPVRHLAASSNCVVPSEGLVMTMRVSQRTGRHQGALLDAQVRGQDRRSTYLNILLARIGRPGYDVLIILVGNLYRFAKLS